PRDQSVVPGPLGGVVPLVDGRTRGLVVRRVGSVPALLLRPAPVITVSSLVRRPRPSEPPEAGQPSGPLGAPGTVGVPAVGAVAAARGSRGLFLFPFCVLRRALAALAALSASGALSAPGVVGAAGAVRVGPTKPLLRGLRAVGGLGTLCVLGMPGVLGGVLVSDGGHRSPLLLQYGQGGDEFGLRFRVHVESVERGEAALALGVQNPVHVLQEQPPAAVAQPERAVRANPLGELLPRRPGAPAAQ